MEMNKPLTSPSPDPSVVDLAALQGAWEQVNVEADGVTDPPDERCLSETFMTITAKHFNVHTGNGTVLLEGIFTLNAAMKPKAVTWVDSMGPDAGKRLPASYMLNDDSFVFRAADEGAPRPIVFRTQPGLTMRSFVRKRSR
jgi:uncharacterized protein (TIGR03067 family)